MRYYVKKYRNLDRKLFWELRMFRVKMSLHCSLQLQLFRRLDHVRSNDNSSMILNPCAVWACMKWTSNFIIQQFYLLFLQKSKTFLRKYIFKNPENNRKKTPFWNKRWPSWKWPQLEGPTIFLYSSNVKEIFMQNLVLVSPSEIFSPLFATLYCSCH